MLPKIDWSDYVVEVVAGLTLMVISAIIGWIRSQRFRRLLRRLPGKLISAIKWLAKQWRYLVIVILLILIEVALYRVYADWKIVASSVAHFALIAVATWLLTPKRRIANALHGFEDNFRFGLNAWITPSGWSPQVNERGLQLIPHDNLSKVLLLEKLPLFVDGVIECEVYLEPNALFNVMLRGSLADDEFYMARLDARPTLWDCILFKPKGEWWRECNKDKGTLVHHSPHSQWLMMRIVADGQRISL